jgi:hypothetical protein
MTRGEELVLTPFIPQMYHNRFVIWRRKDGGGAWIVYQQAYFIGFDGS